MEQFRMLLIQIFNNADLPLDVKYYALKDVFRDVSALYDSALREQYEAAKKDAEEGKSAPVVEKSEEEK